MRAAPVITDMYRNGRRWPSQAHRRFVPLAGPAHYVGHLNIPLQQFLRDPHRCLMFMANVVMNEAKTSIVNRNIDLIADTLKVALISATYTANADDQFIDAGGASDVVDARIAGTTDQTLAGKAIGKDNTGDFAYFDANDVTYTGVASGTAVAAVGYKDTGVATTSKILLYSDIPDIVANGGDITIQWATPANGGVLKLA